METNDIKKLSAELLNMLIQASASLTTIQGIEVGFFDWIPMTKPITAEELCRQMGYDFSRVLRWLRFASIAGYVTKSPEGYLLTTKGSLLRRGSPAPDLLGLFHMVSFFTRAVPYSKDAYQSGSGLDKITQLKISRDYIPRVASQLSRASADFFKGAGVSTGHTILDLGCGEGSVLRETVKSCPGVSATGIDINIQTLELGKRKNAEAGLQDQIDLRVGDITNLSGIQDHSFDWVYSINVIPYLPINRRDTFLREMIRISRYGIFFNQVIANNIATLSVDVLLSTLFSDFSGFFTDEEADEFLRRTGIKHFLFKPVIQGESRMVIMYTSENEIPITRVPGIDANAREALGRENIHTARELLVADPAVLAARGLDADSLRASAIKLLFP